MFAVAEVCRLETDPTGSDPLRVDLSTYVTPTYVFFFLPSSLHSCVYVFFSVAVIISYMSFDILLPSG